MERPSSSPQVKRRKRQVKRLPLFLPIPLWKELSYAAKFATRVFELTQRPETVSRNDFIEDNLIWALAAYWEDKGGKPTSAAEFERRAKEHAAKVSTSEASEAVDGESNSEDA